jgi:hypothetical protein
MNESHARRVNGFATILLSIAGLATSWAGYQASLWSGEQASHNGKAIALRTTATRAATRAGQLRLLDVGIFGNWLTAAAHGDTLLKNFIEARFRPEFSTAFNAWLASRPLTTPNAAPSPFALPEYHLAADDEATRLTIAADSESATSERANNNSDGYVLDAVLFATVLFFASSAQRDEGMRLRGAPLMLAFASVICAVGIVRLVMLPRG